MIAIKEAYKESWPLHSLFCTLAHDIPQCYRAEVVPPASVLKDTGILDNDTSKELQVYCSQSLAIMVTLEYNRYLKFAKPDEDLGGKGGAIITQQIDVKDQSNHRIVAVDVEEVIHSDRGRRCR